MVRTIAIAVAFYAVVFVACAANVYAQNAPTPAWRDVLSTCAEEWRASDARKNAAKGEGMAAWQAWLSECKSRKGFVPKRDQTRTFNRIPDKS